MTASRRSTRRRSALRTAWAIVVAVGLVVVHAEHVAEALPSWWANGTAAVCGCCGDRCACGPACCGDRHGATARPGSRPGSAPELREGAIRNGASDCCDRVAPQTQLSRCVPSLLGGAVTAVELPAARSRRALDADDRHAPGNTFTASPRGPPPVAG